VAIVTAPSTHAEIAVACMEAGKHVFIEKPIALTMDDYDRILEARDRTGMSASIDHIMRFNPLLMSDTMSRTTEQFQPYKQLSLINSGA
jgi:predicted dehydrogenase